MDLAARRTQLKTLLSTISGLQIYDTVPARINAPCAVIAPSSIDTNPVMGAGFFDIEFTVQLMVQLADWASAQKQLDGFLSTGTANSVWDALEKAGSQINMDMERGSYGTVSFDDGASTFLSVTLRASMLADD